MNTLVNILFLCFGFLFGGIGVFAGEYFSLFSLFPKLVDFSLNMGAGLICTVFTVSGVQYWINGSLRKKRERLLKFFGESVKDKNIQLVFARRTLEDENAKFSYPLFNKIVSSPENGVDRSKPPLPKGVDSWLAYDDLQIVASLGKEFGETLPERQLQIALDYLDDSSRENILEDRPTIALGLRFTFHTHEILKKSGLLGTENEENKVFMGWAKGQGDLITDFFTFNKRTCNTPPSNITDYALVVRAKWKNSKNFHFICAGRTASGTAAAGRYLAERYEEMLGFYEKNNKDLTATSLAVLIEHPSGFDEVSQEDAINKITALDHIFGPQVG